jgi:hypothetical protein
MKKFASFIPIVGIIIVTYMVIKKVSADEIWPNLFYYLGSAFVQAICISVPLALFL